MADRTRSTLPGAAGPLEALLARLEALEQEVRDLQSGGARSLPGDWRFVARGGDVFVRRISTGDECRVCGGIGSCTVEVEAHVEMSGTQVGAAGTIRGMNRLGSAWSMTYPLSGCTRPPSPPAPDDPAWELNNMFPMPPVETYAGPFVMVGPVGPSVPCQLLMLRFDGQLGGTAGSIIVFVDGEGPGLGDTAVALDGVWASAAETTWTVPCLDGAV